MNYVTENRMPWETSDLGTVIRNISLMGGDSLTPEDFWA
jgi:hypothetical protein